MLDLALPPETRQALERLIDELPRAVFTVDDSLGWVYQFWQSRKKDEINRSEVKIGADELPAVTQLFTEPYMVRFLLDNTLGAWWAARRLSEADLQEADTEVTLRRESVNPRSATQFLALRGRVKTPRGRQDCTLPPAPSTAGRSTSET